MSDASLPHAPAAPATALGTPGPELAAAANAAANAATNATAARSTLRNAVLLALWMLVCALLALAITPHQRMSDGRPIARLEALVPTSFGEWRLDTASIAGVINPQQNELVDKLYSEVVARAYLNRRGERIMLSIAYGRDQRDTLALHYPEVCYPSQGFQLRSNHLAELSTPFGGIEARQLETVYGDRRYEPVTYWTTLGDRVVRGGVRKKLAEMRYGLRGTVPDGLLFRISSIDRDSAHAFALHQAFASELLAAVNPGLRARLAGLQ